MADDKITLHNADTGQDSVVPNKPKLLAVLAKSGWHPKLAKQAKPSSVKTAGDEPEGDKEQTNGPRRN